MASAIAAILDESCEQPAKRQKLEEAVVSLISTSAKEAAAEAANIAAEKATESCEKFWKAKMAEAPAGNASAASMSGAVDRPESNVADEACMETAAASARVGVRLEHGGPFGASIVRDGVIISCAHNMVLCNKDPTCHAEMTAIRQACKALGTHDLSDCNLYTTCEPCPMCWGAVQWARLNKAYIGVDRHTAAKYGFDDKVFYDEIDGKSGVYGYKRYGYRVDNTVSLETKKEPVQKNMVEIYDGLLRSECEKLFTNPAVNKTFRRRYSQEGTDVLHRAVKDMFHDTEVKRSVCEAGSDISQEQHESFMRMAVTAAEKAAKMGTSKEREPFGAIIVKNGTVIATAANSVSSSRDATATAEVNCIREATINLGTHNLEGCEMYTTVQPDVMSLGAVLWSRISRIYCGVTQKFAAQYGFEEATLHFKDLLEAAGGKRHTEVVEGVSVAECEAVFREWSDRNGVIY